MKTQIKFLLSLLLIVGCSLYAKTKAPIKLPKISSLITDQIHVFQQEEKHGLAWIRYCGSDQKLSPQNLLTDLEQLMDFDIDALQISNYQYQEREKGRLKIRDWKSTSEHIFIWEYESGAEDCGIKLIELSICNPKGEFYLFAPEQGPIQKFEFLDRKYCPVYESRLLGLDEAIREMEKI
ncbi:MAG: hypothetical protein AAF696_34470, partial [Bacteroidota bacterium]